MVTALSCHIVTSYLVATRISLMRWDNIIITLKKTQRFLSCFLGQKSVYFRCWFESSWQIWRRRNGNQKALVYFHANALLLLQFYLDCGSRLPLVRGARRYSSMRPSLECVRLHMTCACLEQYDSLYP